MITLTKAVVEKIIEFSPDLREYVLIPEKYRKYKSGKFLQLTLDKVNASEVWPESRTFSICNGYDKNKSFFRLIIRNAGKYTNRIFNELQEKDICTLKYAFGDMTLPKDVDSDVICIAGGSGIAPFLSFLDDIEKNELNDKLHILYSSKTVKEMLYIDRIKKVLSKNFYPFITREQSEFASNRRIELSDIISTSKKTNDPYYYICGSPDFINYFKTGLIDLGKTKILVDEWE